MNMTTTPKFIAERTVGTLSYSYRPRNDAAYKVCRLAKRNTLTDEDMKLLDLIGVKWTVEGQNGTISA